MKTACVHNARDFILVPVMNQGGGQPESRFYETVHRIADRISPEFQQAFIDAVEAVRDQVDLVALESAVRSGDLEAVRTALGSGQLGEVLGRREGLRELFTRGYLETGGAAGSVLARSLGVDFSFDARDPNSIIFARRSAGTLVTRIDRDQLLTIRGILGRSQVEGIPPRRTARILHGTVGIRHDWALAPSRLRQEILDGHAGAATSRRLDAVTKQEIRSRISAGTVTDDWLDDVVGRYEHSLRRRRALDIARTETIRSGAAGREASWRQAVRHGVLDSNARRFWIVTPDERLRETHAAVPFDNPEGVGINEPFDTFLGPVMHEPLEPLCRCGVGLVPNPQERSVII